MNEIITVYKIHCVSLRDPSRERENCSLLPWGGDPDWRGRDDGGREYVLPGGYAQGRSPDGGPAVFGPKGNSCGLMLHNGCPLLIDREKQMAHLLEPVRKIATYRHLAGLSREALAQKLGVSQKEVFEWENLEKEPDENTLRRLAEALGCKISDFR